MGKGLAVSTGMMKFGLSAAMVLFLSACSSSPSQEQEAQKVIGVGRSMVAQLRAPKSTGMPQFTRAQIDHATMRLMLFEIESDKRGASSGLINSNSGVETFITGDGIGLMMREGVVVSSRGFGLDMMSSSGPSLAQIKQGKGSWTRSYQHIGLDDQIVQRRFQCEVSAEGAENVTIAQKTYATQKYAEACHGESGQMRNEYWIDTAGTVRQSRQWLNTALGMLRIADPM